MFILSGSGLVIKKFHKKTQKPIRIKHQKTVIISKALKLKTL